MEARSPVEDLEAAMVRNDDDDDGGDEDYQRLGGYEMS